MTERIKGFEVLEKYRKGNTGWLPLIRSAYCVYPKRNEYGEVNIGWNAGLLEENRPFFSMLWAVDCITMLTMYFSAKGIEDITAEQAEKMFEKIGYYKRKDPDGGSHGSLMKFNDPEDGEFFSFNVTVGVEDEPAEIEGGNIYPLKTLNDYNFENEKGTQEEE